MPSTEYDQLKTSFIGAGIPEELVSELLNEYEANKRRYFLNDYGPAAINGGRFSEVVTRIIQHLGTATYTPLSAEIKVDRELNKAENYTNLGEGLRLHIPRAMRLIYGIRNKRNTAHLKDGIDANLQDATLVVGCLDWTLAELVRVAHNVTPEEAQALIANIVTKEVPLIEEFEGVPVVLRDLPRRDHVLVILYWAGSGAIPLVSLRRWLPTRIKRYVGQLLKDLEGEHLVHVTNDSVYLTGPGIRYVEVNSLLRPL